LTILKKNKRLRYDPNEIIAQFSRIKSLKQRDKGLANNSKMLEKTGAKYRRILPLGEQIAFIGIGIDPSIAFNIVVTQTAETYNIPISAAAFRVINEIEDYRKVIGPKEELFRLAVQIYATNEILRRKTKAITALFKLCPTSSINT
jgi:antitoxin component of RelBE/YafQ-DinJ toxin-antitoxin module